MPFHLPMGFAQAYLPHCPAMPDDLDAVDVLPAGSTTVPNPQYVVI